MNLLEMRPKELKEAVEKNLPAVMAAGVTEYHGPHLPLGTDYFIADMLVREVEKRLPVVVVPGITYGPTMNWAGGAAEGDWDFAAEPMAAYAKEILRNISLTGFKRIFVIQFHAGSDGLQYLALKRAAAELLAGEARALGEGWGRTEPPPGFFGKYRVFNLEAMCNYAKTKGEEINFCHAGAGETEWIMNRNESLVKLEELTPGLQKSIAWLADSKNADKERGRKHIALCADFLASQMR